MSALSRQVMDQGAVGDLVARRDGGRRGIGILDVPIAIQFLKSQRGTAQIRIREQRGVTSHHQPVGHRLGRFGVGGTGQCHEADDQMPLDAVVGPLGDGFRLGKD